MAKSTRDAIVEKQTKPRVKSTKKSRHGLHNGRDVLGLFMINNFWPCRWLFISTKWVCQACQHPLVIMCSCSSGTEG